MNTTRPCPEGAVLMLAGGHFPCDQMRHMCAESDNHDGWAHSNSDADAVWSSVPVQDIEAK